MDSVFFILEIIGTVAFAVSGAMIAIKKGMDIFGVIILGLSTAVGGGIIRDIILGITPPTTFTSPVYSLVAIVASIAVFLPFVHKVMVHNKKFYDILLLVTDSIGLGVFSVMGVKVAYTALNHEYNFFFLVFVGVVTGVGGGIMRDLFANTTPLIFIKHFYACASLLGTIVCVVLLSYNVNMILAMAVGAFIVVILRILAAKFRWQLPKSHFTE